MPLEGWVGIGEPRGVSVAEGGLGEMVEVGKGVADGRAVAPWVGSEVDKGVLSRGLLQLTMTMRRPKTVNLDNRVKGIII